MTCTEFYCDPVNGSNLNAGSTTGAPSVTETNGGWNSGTGVFTAASGTPFSGVAVGEWASVYVDGATTGVFVGRITAVGGGGATITVSLTAAGGSPPSTLGTTRSCRVGGAWKGPSGADTNPFALLTTSMRDASNNPCRVNMRNNATYSVTAGLSTPGGSGAMFFEGYTTTPGDGGVVTLDGGTTGASYTLFTLNSDGQVMRNFVLKNNGATGGAHGFNVAGRCHADHIAISGMRGAGLNVNGSRALLSEIEVTNCNAGSGAAGAVLCNSTLCSTYLRVVVHDNTAGTTNGFKIVANTHAVFIGCIADTNSGDGWSCDSQYGAVLINCDAYNNTGDGWDWSLSGSTQSGLFAENCNFVLNGGYGINASTGVATSGNGTRATVLHNCAFGTGTKANALGTVAPSLDVYVADVGRLSYSSNTTPYRDPVNGDFTISGAEAQGTGRGTFYTVTPSYGGTLAANNIGAGGLAVGSIPFLVTFG